MPARSTFAEANKRRSYKVFERIYYDLHNRYGSFLADSCSKNELKNRLILVDSTTISLFKEVLKNAGRKDANGKRKGGIKVHMAVSASQNIPQLIKLTPAACHDAPFMKQLSPAPGSILVMDMAYQNFSILNKWIKDQVHWVTRLKNNSIIEVLSQNILSDDDKSRGVLTDQIIMLGTPNYKKIERVRCRLVEFYDQKNKKTFSFITSIENMEASTIADIYKQRWQIELLFKRLKQNMPLDYFLGDNENAIKVQIFCALIADLLLQVLKKKVSRGWAYSNLVSFIRLHLMNYTNVYKFLENPDKCIIENPPLKMHQLKLFHSG